MLDSESELNGISGIIKGKLAKGKEERWSFLCDAVKCDSIEVVRSLVQEGTEVNREGVNVNTPLHFAAKQGNEEIVRLLVEKNALINAPNSQDETPLHLAAGGGYLNIVNLLLTNSADVDAQNYKCSTPLLLATESEHEDVVKTLLEHGACINAKDVAGNTPLYFAIEKKNSVLVNSILQHNPHFDDKIHKLVVRLVVHNDDPQSEIVENLINHGLRLNREDISGCNLLYVAVIKGYTKLIEYLLNHDPDAVNNSSLLQCAVGMGHKEIIKLFLDQGCEVRGTDIIDYVPVCSLEDSNERNNVEIIQLLLSSGADVRDAPTSLHKAVDEECTKVCEILLKNGADVNSLDECGHTPLHVAVAKMYTQDEGEAEETVRGKIIRLLLSNDSDMSFKTEDGLAVIHRAVLNRRVDAIRILLEYGVGIDSRAEDDSTPLHVAAAEGYTELIQFFVSNKANVDARRKDGWTPLHMAASSGHSEAVRLFVKFDVDIDALTTVNETALHLAVCKRRHEVVAVLLSSGCDVNVRNCDGEGVLDVVAARAKFPYASHNIGGLDHFAAIEYAIHDNIINIANPNNVPLNIPHNHNPVNLNYPPLNIPHNQNPGYPNNPPLLIPHNHHPVNITRHNLFPNFGVSNDFLIVKLFRKHAMKLKISGLCVSEELLRFLEKQVDVYGLSDFQSQCEEELSRMNDKKFGTYTLRDLLTGHKNPTFARDKSLMQAFESFDFSEFPIYGGLVINSFRKSKQRIAQLSVGQKSLRILLKVSNVFNNIKSPALPPELLEGIVSHLSGEDFKSLVCCVESFQNSSNLNENSRNIA